MESLRAQGELLGTMKGARRRMREEGECTPQSLAQLAVSDRPHRDRLRPRDRRK